MNRKGLWIVPLVAAFAAVGCNADGSAAEPAPTAAPATVVTTPLAYDDGQPIVARTSDPAALAGESCLEALINNHRALVGLAPLVVMAEAKDLARGHSINMATQVPGFFDHCNPQGDLPSNRAEKAAVAFLAVGENLAAGHPTPSQVFQAWLQSPGHRANLENPRWTHMGVGQAYEPSSLYGAYWTLTLFERTE